MVIAIPKVLAWIGYTLAATPLPKPIEEIEKEVPREIPSGTRLAGRKQVRLLGLVISAGLVLEFP